MLSVNFSPFPILETERFILRRVANTDVNEIFELRSNPETMKYIPRPLVKTNQNALQHIETIDAKIESNEGINWAITFKGKDKLIGLLGHYRINLANYRAEVGYMLLPEFHRQGIISEALERIIEYGFNEMKLHSIEAVIDPKNYASERVLQKLDFVKEAHFKENEFFDGKFWDSIVYSKLKKK